MKSVRNLTLTLLTTAAFGLGTLQIAQAQGTNQSGSQAGAQAQSQGNPQGQAIGGKQSAASNRQSGTGNQQGASNNNMSAGGQQGAGNNMNRSMRMGSSGQSRTVTGGGPTSVTTQKNATVRNGRPYAAYGQPENRTTIIHKLRPADRYVYLHKKRYHGPSDRYVILHKKRYYGYVPSGSSRTTVINEQRRGHVVGGVSGGSARINTQQTTTSRSATGMNAGAGASGHSAADVNRSAGGASQQGSVGGTAQQGGNKAGQSMNKSPAGGAASSQSNAGGSSAR